jgi:hypothetical protein
MQETTCNGTLLANMMEIEGRGKERWKERWKREGVERAPFSQSEDL